MPRKLAKSDLNEKQRRFCREYLVDRNATQAAIRAGYAPKAAGQQGDSLLKHPQIKLEIEEGERALAIRTNITAEKVLEKWWKIVEADPNEIIRHEVDSCRFCHGIDHKFQWRDRDEFDKAIASAVASAKEDEQPLLPSDEGGYGFTPHKPPHPKCPRCDGRGQGLVVVADTRKLTGAAKMLYAGVKQTRNGIEVLMLDKHKALENIARHLGMFNDKLKLEGDPENPLAVLLKQVQGSALPVASPAEDAE